MVSQMCGYSYLLECINIDLWYYYYMYIATVRNKKVVLLFYYDNDAFVA